MRTTVRLEDSLLLEAKRHALETRRTLTELMREALVSLLSRERAQVPRRRATLPVFGADGLREGIDINDTSSLLDRMEGLDGR